MKRVREICLDTNGEMRKNASDKCEAMVYYYDGDSEKITYDVIEKLDIPMRGVKLCNKLIKDIVLPPKDKLLESKGLVFEDCVFINKCDLNFYNFNSKISFHNCIFMSDFILFGNFDSVVSFDGTTFINAKVSFQESVFNYFAFNLITLNNCVVDFQQTVFYSKNLFFNELNLHKSKLLFVNTFFSNNSKLFDLTASEADLDSEILFRMVDFNFAEVRLFHSNIKRLEFTDCTFECNHFDFDLVCETLIMQDCKNFKVLSFRNLDGMKNFNIYNFVNTGKVIINQNPKIYIKAIQSDKKIIWMKGKEYKVASKEEYLNQYYSLYEFYGIEHQRYKELVMDEVKLLSNDISIVNNTMKIFLSYCWKDESIANSVEKIFGEKGINLVRDIRDLRYKSSIKEFMKQIRKGDYSFIIISEDYLKSLNCMYEMGEFIKDESYKDRILPIVKKGTNIFNAIGRLEYSIYWQNEYKTLEQKANQLENIHRSSVNMDLIRIEKIRQDLPVVLDYISDINVITYDNEFTEMDFEIVWNEIRKDLY